MDNPFPYFVGMGLVTGLLLGLTPVARKIGLVDHPDSRKQHDSEIPLIGGLAIFISLVLSLLLFDIPLGQFRIFFFSLGIIMIVGVLDDHNDLPAYTKFTVQIFVSVVIVFGDNLIVRSIGDIWANDDPQGLGFLSIPFTVTAIVGVINAFNFTDGHDGLAAALGITCILAILLVDNASLSPLPVQHFVFLSILLVLLSVFLIFNLQIFPNLPKIFLGDAGSMFLGLTFAYLLIDSTSAARDTETLFSPAVAPWIIGLPLLDMFRVVLNRILSGRSPLKADRQHIHHLLLNLGINRIRILLILVCTQIILAGVGVSATIFDYPDWILVWGALVVFILYFFVVNNLIGRILIR